MVWPVERCYAALEPLPNAEVSGLPRDFLVESDQTRRDPCHRPFVRPRSRFDVKIDVPCQIKTDFGWCGNRCQEINHGHGQLPVFDCDARFLCSPSSGLGQENGVPSEMDFGGSQNAPVSGTSPVSPQI